MPWHLHKPFNNAWEIHAQGWILMECGGSANLNIRLIRLNLVVGHRTPFCVWSLRRPFNTGWCVWENRIISVVTEWQLSTAALFCDLFVYRILSCSWLPTDRSTLSDAYKNSRSIWGATDWQLSTAALLSAIYLFAGC
jgi:hypothetical protein